MWVSAPSWTTGLGCCLHVSSVGSRGPQIGTAAVPLLLWWPCRERSTGMAKKARTRARRRSRSPEEGEVDKITFTQDLYCLSMRGCRRDFKPVAIPPRPRRIPPRRTAQRASDCHGRAAPGHPRSHARGRAAAGSPPRGTRRRRKELRGKALARKAAARKAPAPRSPPASPGRDR